MTQKEKDAIKQQNSPSTHGAFTYRDLQNINNSNQGLGQQNAPALDANLLRRSRANNTERDIYADYGSTDYQTSASIESGGKNYFGKSKHDDTFVGRDINSEQLQQDRYDSQSTIDVLANGVMKAAGKTLTTAINGTVGLLAGVGESLYHGDASYLWNNKVSQAMAAVDEYMEDNFQNYRSVAQQNAPWYDPRYWGAAGFADNFIANAGFMLGANLSMGAISSVAGKLASLKRMQEIAKAIGLSGKVGKAASNVVSAWVEANGEAGIEAINASNEWKKEETARFQREFREQNAAEMAAIEEEYQRNLQNDSFTEEVNENTGRKTLKSRAAAIREARLQELNNKYSAGLAEIEERAKAVGNNTYAGNLAVLTASNLITWGKAMGDSYDRARNTSLIMDKAMGSDFIGSTKTNVKDSAKKAYATLKSGEKIANEDIVGMKKGFEHGLDIFDNTKAGVLSKRFLSEGVWEEGMQGAVATASKMNATRENVDDYWRVQLDPDNVQAGESWISDLGKAMGIQYGTAEGLQEVVIGGVSGTAGMYAFGRGSKKSDGTERAWYDPRRYGSWNSVYDDYKDYKERKANAQKNIDALNQAWKSEDTWRAIENMAAINNHIERRDEAAANGDKKKYKDEDAKIFARLINSAVRSGRTDVVREMISSAWTDMSDEEIDQLVEDASPEIGIGDQMSSFVANANSQIAELDKGIVESRKNLARASKNTESRSAKIAALEQEITSIKKGAYTPPSRKTKGTPQDLSARQAEIDRLEGEIDDIRNSSLSKNQQKKEIKNRQGVINRLQKEITSLSATTESSDGLSKKERAALRKAEGRLAQLQKNAQGVSDETTKYQEEIDAYEARKAEIQGKLANVKESDFTPFRDTSSGWVDKFGNRIKTNDEIRKEFNDNKNSLLKDLDSFLESAAYVTKVTEGKTNDDQDSHLTYLHYLMNDKISRNNKILAALREQLPQKLTLDFRKDKEAAEKIQMLKNHGTIGPRLTESAETPGVYTLDTTGMEDEAFAGAMNYALFRSNEESSAANFTEIKGTLISHALNNMAQNHNEDFQSLQDFSDALDLYRESQEFWTVLDQYLHYPEASTAAQMEEVKKAQGKKATKDANSRSVADWIKEADNGTNLDEALQTPGLSEEAAENIKKAKDAIGRRNAMAAAANQATGFSEQERQAAMQTLQDISDSLESGSDLSDTAKWEQFVDSIQLDQATVQSVMNDPTMTDAEKQQALRNLKRARAQDLLDIMFEADEQQQQSAMSQQDMQVADEIAQIAEESEDAASEIPDSARDGAIAPTPVPDVTIEGSNTPTVDASVVVQTPAADEVKDQPIITNAEATDAEIQEQEQSITEQTPKEPKSNGNVKSYWKTNTTEVAIKPDKVGDNAPYHEKTDSANKALYQAVHEFLTAQRAFDRIKSGEVKPGVKLRLGVNRELYNKTGVVVPLVYMQDNQGHWVIIGDMMSINDKTGSTSAFTTYPNYENFLQKVTDLFNKTESANDVIYPLDLEVRDMLVGRPAYTEVGQRNTLNAVFQNKPFKIGIKTGNIAHPILVDADVIGGAPTELESSVQTPLSGNPGQPYVLIESSRGYIPVPFSMPRFDSNNEALLQTELGKKAQVLMSQMEHVAEMSDTELKTFMKNFQKVFAIEHLWIEKKKEKGPDGKPVETGMMEFTYKLRGDTRPTSVIAPKEQMAGYVTNQVIPNFNGNLGFQIDAFQMNNPSYNQMIGEVAEVNLVEGATHTLNDFPIFDFVGADGNPVAAISPTAPVASTDNKIITVTTNIGGTDVSGVINTETGVFVPTDSYDTLYAIKGPDGKITLHRATSNENSIAKMTSRKVVQINRLDNNGTIEVPISQVVGWAYGSPKVGFKIGIGTDVSAEVRGVGDNTLLYNQALEEATDAIKRAIGINDTIATAPETPTVTETTPPTLIEVGVIDAGKVFYDPTKNSFVHENGTEALISADLKSRYWCEVNGIATPTVTPFSPEGTLYDPVQHEFISSKPDTPPTDNPPSSNEEATKLTPEEKKSIVDKAIKDANLTSMKRAASKVLNALNDEQLATLRDLDMTIPFNRDTLKDIVIQSKSLDDKAIREKFDDTFKSNRLIIDEYELPQIEGVKEAEKPVSIDDITSLILNSPSGLNSNLVSKILNVAKELGVTISLGHNDLGKNVAGLQRGSNIKIAGWVTTPQSIKDGTAAHAIIHELIHGVTEYVIDAYDEGRLQDENLINAVKTLKACYEVASKSTTLAKEYGLTNVKEMIAELSNRRFREKAKKVGLWQSIKNAIKSIFTRNNVDSQLEEALNTILDNYDANLFKQQTSTNNNYDVDTVAIQKEMNEIRQRAIENGTFMKAPNGADTNLTERQWLQVRTKAFKDWFGDWERVAENNLGTASGNTDISKILNKDGSINFEALEKISDEFFKNADESLFKKGRKTLRTRKEHHVGEDNTLEHLQNVAKSAQESNIREDLKPQLLLAAALHDLAKPFHGGQRHGFQSVEIINSIFKGNISNLAKFAIRHHMMTVDEDVSFTQEDADRIIQDAVDNNLNVQDAIEMLLALNIADITSGRDLSTIDQYAKKPLRDAINAEIPIRREMLERAATKIKSSNVSKVVDENGEPLVVYHGTNVKFGAFNYEGNRVYNDGFYFTSDIKYAKSIAANREGDVIMPVFLNIKNPITTDTPLMQGKTEGIYILEGGPGKDGIVGHDFDTSEFESIIPSKGTEYHVTKGTQVKSATDNVGTFRQDDDRINYLKFKESQGEFYNEADDIERMPMSMRVQRAKWSNISAGDRQILSEMGVTPQIWQRLNLEQREEMLRCAV